jgi:tetraacyldisaccharide 4'-kinase
MLVGLARPDGFRRTLEGLGARVIAERVFPDHHPYRRGDLRDLAREAIVWVTTEKDAVKILQPWTRGIDLRVLDIEIEVQEAATFIGEIEERLQLRGNLELA